MTQHGIDVEEWTASMVACATSTSYDDYLAKMAANIARRDWPATDHLLECWWHEPARQLWAWHAESQDGTWLGNVEFIDGRWLVTQPDHGDGPSARWV